VRIPNNALAFRPPRDVLQAIDEVEPTTMDTPPAASGGIGRARQVWRYDGKRFTPVAVSIGLSDDAWTEMIAGPLHDGDALATQAALRRVSR